MEMDSGIEQYFEEYQDLEIHDLMLKDRPRQEAYSKAISNNKHLFKDKIVLDVGAGTGILSAFCAKAGAKLVYAVEASDLAKIALEVIEENELTSVVKVIRSKIEDFVLPASMDKVDIIVSEWMGFYLLHEGMLDSVIFARDKFLKEGGIMFPQEATIHVAPCSVPSLYKYYENVDGIKMNRFAKKLRAQKSSKPEICCLGKEDLLAEGTVMHFMNLEEVTLEEIEEIKFDSVVPIEYAGRFEGLCIWFEVLFPADNREDSVILSTEPHSPATHWKQCVVVLPEEACIDVEKDEPVSFFISMKRNADNARRYNLEVEVKDSDKVEHPLPCSCHMTKCILMKAHFDRVEAGEMVVDDDEGVQVDNTEE
ncbi:protein arginine N-methyltransferase 6 [Episyrphus balteatus]|uniref:protein arginine N-methyltransferase 6 n=1 Tax=Episyrphus balteatus TaxID=286459 RepID=UPI002485D1CF|nr:protein arginine N-methyltransferase 6 [Episyrphus balteatus]